MYTTAALDGIMSEILVSIKFVNLSPKTISNLQLNLPDSSTMKVVRMVRCSCITLSSQANIDSKEYVYFMCYMFCTYFIVY